MQTNGLKTSEFIMSLIPVVIGVVLIVLGAWKGQQHLVDNGLMLTLGGSGTYGVARGLAKLGSGIGGTAPAAPTPAPADDKAAADAVAKVQ